MKLKQSIGSELYSLFGPNGSNSIVGRNQKRRMSALRELERHGLVEIKERDGNMAELMSAPFELHPTRQPLTYASAMKLAEECESRADNLYPCEENLPKHVALMERAMSLRRIASRIASHRINCPADGSAAYRPKDGPTTLPPATAPEPVTDSGSMCIDRDGGAVTTPAGGNPLVGETANIGRPHEVAATGPAGNATGGNPFPRGRWT